MNIRNISWKAFGLSITIFFAFLFIIAMVVVFAVHMYISITSTVRIESSDAVRIITGVIALIGIVGGYILNGVLQRISDDRKYRQESQRKKEDIHHQKLVFRTMLLAELKSVKDIYKSELDFIRASSPDKMCEDNPQGYINFFTNVPTGFFIVVKNGWGDLGLLSVNAVADVMNAYYIYQEHTGYIIRNGAFPDKKYSTTLPYDLNGHDKHAREWLEDCLSKIVYACDRALISLA